MPIALLLQGTAGAFRLGAGRLAGWNELVRLEALLVARARSAFLVRWFGRDLPLEGSRLRVAIGNLPALKERYLSTSSRPARAEGLDIGVPLMGMLGTAAGSALNPVMAILISLAGALEGVWTALLSLLGMVVAPLAFGILAGLGPLPWVPLLMINPGDLAGNLGLLVAVGGLLPPLLPFLDTLRENWAPIADSLLALLSPIFANLGAGEPPVHRDVASWVALFEAGLPLADRLAFFVPLLLTAASSLILVLGPWLGPLAEVIGPFLVFVRRALDALQALWSDLMTQLTEAVSRHQLGLGAVQSALTAGGDLLGILQRLLSGFLDPALDFLRSRWSSLRSALVQWKDVLVDALGEVFERHPLMVFFRRVIEAARSMIRTLQSLVSRAARVALEGAGSAVGGPLGGAAGRELHRVLAQEVSGLLSGGGGSFRDFLPELPEPTAIERRLAQPRSFDEAMRRVAVSSEMPPSVPGELVRRRSVFGGERAALRREIASQREELEEADRRERQLREFLFDVVGQALPSSVQSHLRSLSGVLERLDHALARELPVRELAENDRLALSVSELRVKLVAPRSSEDAASPWVRLLHDQLLQADYRVAG